MTTDRETTRDIVLLGASRGGVAALARIVSALPAHFPAAVLVVLHQPPHGPRLLEELLGARSAMPVAYARDGDLIEQGRIYLALPDHHLIVRSDSRLGLEHGAKVRHSRPAVDVLFQSAAAVFRDRVIGVILTGGDHDGTDGMNAIAAARGIGIVQSPSQGETGLKYSLFKGVHLQWHARIALTLSPLRAITRIPTARS